MGKARLRSRALRIWRVDYLHYRYLWPNIESAVQRALASLRLNSPVVLDIGCGQRPYRDLFGGCSYIGLDYGTEDTCPDVLGDASCLPFAAGTVDMVFSTQVIEHVRYPDLMVKECGRVLRPGGYLVLTGPFYWPLHEEPLDFHRFTRYGFAGYLRDAGFTDWEIKPDGGDWAQICLSISLRLKRRWLAPLRVVVNSVGTILDSSFASTTCPANYTIIARR